VAYDVLAESVALIEAGRAEPVPRLSRRRRFAAMAVDVAGDVAVTMFARRGVGRIWKETHVLALRDGEWTWLGGGGSDGDQDLLADRPTVLPAFLGLGAEPMQGADPRVMAVSGSGGVLDDGDGTGRGRQSERWISHATLRVNAHVTSVQVAERLLVVPWHGHVVVVWSERQPPRVVALDEGGNSRAEIQLASTH
jgi:hypothetical protein